MTTLSQASSHAGKGLKKMLASSCKVLLSPSLSISGTDKGNAWQDASCGEHGTQSAGVGQLKQYLFQPSLASQSPESYLQAALLQASSQN